MITLLDLLNLSDPFERMYMYTESQVIINLSRHLGTGKLLPTDEWRIQKLSEVNSITQETIEIIAANTGRLPQELIEVFGDAIKLGTMETNSLLNRARNAGVLVGAPRPEDTQAMAELLQAYVAQAQQTFNLVNTNMLNSTLRQYKNAVEHVAWIEKAQGIRGANGAGEAQLRERLLLTLGTLNTATSSVVVGIESRNKAVRDAIKSLADRGITGWIDAGGHHWTAEAYVNMDIRTTAHNVAIEAQKQRSAEYGVSTFQISVHSGARPLCAPYQGWVCSWEGGGGVVHDLYGKEYRVHDINETSYGEAAGIFGINCGHFPETFVDGFSVPRYNELTPEEEKQNAIEYAQSQQQRHIEREIRQAKTEALAMKAANDPEGFKEAARKAKEKSAEYRSFCEQTGRTPRPDRTQVVGYNREIAGLAKTAAKSPKGAPIAQAKSKKEKGDFLQYLEKTGIARRKVEKLPKKLSEAEIIERICGADKTGGSCASVAFAYAGNRRGYDVLDYRGGRSRTEFSHRDWKIRMVKKGEVAGKVESAKNDFKAANALIASIKPNKQYILCTGGHAAVIRINPDTGEFEWLELQSASNNGWHSLTDDVLRWRFGCKKSHGGREVESVLIDIDSLGKYKDFRSILEYLNTAPDAQKKGEGGGIK